MSNERFLHQLYEARSIFVNSGAFNSSRCRLLEVRQKTNFVGDKNKLSCVAAIGVSSVQWARNENHIDLFQSLFIICHVRAAICFAHAMSFDRCTSVLLGEHHNSRCSIKIAARAHCAWPHMLCVCNEMHTFTQRELACVEYLMRFRCIIYLSHGTIYVFAPVLASQQFLIRKFHSKKRRRLCDNYKINRHKYVETLNNDLMRQHLV